MRASDKISNNKWMFGLGLLLLILFIGAGSFTIALYSPWGRAYALNLLNDAIKENGWTFSPTKVEGSLPEEMTFHNLTLSSSQGDSISIELLKIKIALWALLKKELLFTQFEAEKISWVASSNRPEGEKVSQEREIPYKITFPHLKVRELFLPGKIEQKIDFSGKIRIESANRMAYAKLYWKLPEADGTLLFLRKKNQITQLKIDTKIASSEFLSSWFDPPCSSKGVFHLYAKGDWESFIELFRKKREPSKTSLNGWLRFNGDVQQSIIPSATWAITSLFKYSNQNILFSRLNAKSDLLNARGSLSFTGTELTKASLHVSIENLGLWNFGSLGGSLVAKCLLKENKAHLHFSSPKAVLDFIPFEQVEGESNLIHQGEEWQGTATAKGIVCGKLGEAETSLTWNPKTNFVSFKEFKAHSPLFTASGGMEFFKDLPWKGELQLQSADLHELSLCNPAWNFFGSVTGSLILKGETVQETEFKLRVSNFFYHDLRFEEALLSALFFGEYGQVQGEINNSQWNTLYLKKTVFKTERSQESWPWNFASQGEWNAPFELGLNGSISKNDRELFITAEQGSGTFLSHSIGLSSPIQFNLSPTRCQLSPAELKIGSGVLQLSFEQQESATRAKILCQKIPLDLFSANPLEIDVQGFMNVNGELATIHDKTHGSLSLELTKVLIIAEEPLTASATLTATLGKDRLIFDTKAIIRSKPLLHLSGDIPIHIDLNRMKIEVHPFQPASGFFSFDGRMEEILDFLNLGPNRFEGNCKAEFRLSNTLHKPLVSGSLTVRKGRYENYFTGTELRKVAADVVAKGDTLILSSFSGRDGQKKGKLSLTGELQLLYRDHFPFRFEGKFSRLNVVDTQWVQMDADGELQIKGNSQMMKISGKALIAESEITIPDRIPAVRPELAVKYIHLPAFDNSIPKKISYPIFFDYVVDAPDSIFISGRGLSSEWKGSVVLSGRASQLELKGSYDLMSGTFNFAGRNFNLTEGSLIFGGKPNTFPFLNLAAEAEIQNISIMASLKGPLDAPLLSLYSTPALPSSVVLSHLLFEEDLAELDALQAAQLMTSLASLSGGKNILEKTRQALGIDRLRIIATPIDDQGGKSYALQVGKYVTRNLLLSISQGTEGDSTNLNVELNLGNGLIFQAESQQEVEQGKFTLKWNVNY